MPYITIDNREVYFRSAGAANPKPLVFLHGSGGDGSVWGYQLKGLKNICRVIVPDMPGHGKSQPFSAAEGSVEQYAAWLHLFIGALKLKTPVIAGHSLGGAVVQRYAADHPGQISAIVLAGTGERFAVAGQYVKLVQTDFKQAVALSCRQAYASDVAPELRQNGLSMLTRNGAETLYNDMLACSVFDSSSWVDRICCPSYIICGQEDSITPPELSETLAGKLPSGRLIIIPGSGHMVMAEAPERFNREMAHIIRSD